MNQPKLAPSPLPSARPMRVVVITGAVLLVLWALSFGLSYAPLGGAALPVAMAVAVVKAALVVFVFMELARERLSVKLPLVASVGLLVVLIGLVLTDIAMREPAPLAPFEAQPSGAPKGGAHMARAPGATTSERPR